MPRVSRSVSQRYANASKQKSKRRGEGRAAILPPQLDSAPLELAPGLSAPMPLEIPAETAAPQRPGRSSSRAESRAMTRGEMRHAVRRVASAPIVDYSYVAGDLRRIGIVAGVLFLVLIALTLVPTLH
jgi:hypothetical protein